MRYVSLVASQYHTLPKNIDTIEIFTLSGDTDVTDTNGFFGDPQDPIKTLDHKTVTGEAAKEIAKLWGNFQIGPIIKQCVLIRSMAFNSSERAKFIFAHQFVGTARLLRCPSHLWEM